MQGQTYHLWVACQEGPGLECRNTYCSCRYAGLTAPAPPPAFLCNGWELYCQNCPFDVSVCAMCMSVRMCVCLCLCVCVCMYVCKHCFSLFMCMCVFVYVQTSAVLMSHALLRKHCHSACLHGQIVGSRSLHYNAKLLASCQPCAYMGAY